MMNPEIKTKWVEALRSGEYKQGKFKLKHEDSYCCLGVLCDLYSKEFNVSFPNKCQNSVPEDDVIEWASLPNCNPKLKYKGNDNITANLNDKVGLNFKELADLIEEQL